MNEPLSDSDDQLSLKKRARRRLIGAIVFVTFAAIVLPMVMDEEAPPATPNIELNIPAQEKGFVAPPTGAPKPAIGVAEPVPAPAQPSVVAPLAALAPPKPAAAETRLPEPVAPVAAKPVAEAKPKSAPESKPATETKPKPAAEAKPTPAKEAKPPAKPEGKPGKAEPVKAGSDAKRAQALLEGRATDTGGGDGAHVVLIGAFSNAGNVRLIQKKLSEMGIKVFTETFDSPQGKKTRVRAGPFSSREAAEKAAARMKSIGVGGVVAAKP